MYDCLDDNFLATLAGSSREALRAEALQKAAVGAVILGLPIDLNVRHANRAREPRIKVCCCLLGKVRALVAFLAARHLVPVQRQLLRTCLGLVDRLALAGVHTDEKINARLGLDRLGAEEELLGIATFLVHTSVLSSLLSTNARRELEVNSIGEAVSVEELLQRRGKCLAGWSFRAEEQLEQRLVCRGCPAQSQQAGSKTKHLTLRHDDY